MKPTILFTAALILSTGFPLAAFAISYQPGQTLNPSCPPTDPTCVVVANTAGAFVATSSTATSTFAGNVSVSGTVAIGGLNGILKAVAGVITSALVNLATDVTGVLPIANGGTATSTQATSGINYFDGTEITSGSSLTYDGSSVFSAPLLHLTQTTGTTTLATGQGFTIGGSQFVLQQGSGNVGVGTANPSQKLDVEGGNINVGAGGAYDYNGSNIITASTTLGDYFFGTAGNLTTTGVGNNAVGGNALYTNTTGYYNDAIGDHALYTNTTGESNNAVGANALFSNTTGSGNNAIGSGALYSNTTGSYNHAFGTDALHSNTTGYDNDAFGDSALQANTTGESDNAFGHAALLSNTTGYNNNTFGDNSLRSNTTGYNNSGFGDNALYFNTTGIQNTAVGENSLQANTTASSNTAVGQDALYSNTTGSPNSAHGVSALYSNTTGGDNDAWIPT